MWQLFVSETEVLIHRGFFYLPLLLDPQIKAELDNLTGSGAPPLPGTIQTLSENLTAAAGAYFVKSLSLNSLVENYPAVFPEEYERERLSLRSQVFPGALSFQPLLDHRLRTILFDILPHFLSSRRHGRVGPVPVLKYLAARVPRSPGQTEFYNRLRERQLSIQQVLLRLKPLERPPASPWGCYQHGQDLAGWLRQALQARIVTQEIRHWQKELSQVQEFLDLPGPQLAALLEIVARRTVEVDGFGCVPDKKHPGEYLVYKRTGAFLLQDYFGRPYLFPDCRVGVSTAGPFHPMVLEKYKHPLLRRFSSRQQICLKDYQAASDFSAAAVIKALEEGLGALFYGYNPRKRNGYNSLDGYGRHLSVVDFEDWRLPPDDPRVASGTLEIKNNTF
jgi:hypothetical protein